MWSPWPWPKGEGFTPRWELANFIIDVLEASALGESGGFYLCPPHGHWNHGSEYQRDSYWRYYRIRDAILTNLGIPAQFAGAVFFSHSEQDKLATTVFARTFMIDDRAGDCSDDVWVYPSHGRLYLHFDDEEITWAMSNHRDVLLEFDTGMIRRDWDWLRDERRNSWDWPLTFWREQGKSDHPSD